MKHISFASTEEIEHALNSFVSFSFKEYGKKTARNISKEEARKYLLQPVKPFENSLGKEITQGRVTLDFLKDKVFAFKSQDSGFITMTGKKWFSSSDTPLTYQDKLALLLSLSVYLTLFFSKSILTTLEVWINLGFMVQLHLYQLEQHQEKNSILA